MAVLVVLAVRFHPVGDYYTETDFYGGYVEGARLFQAGHPDPARYGVVGPVYDATLALIGRIRGDLFAAGQAIAIVTAIVTLLCTYELVRRRAGASAALWTTAFLAANATFFRMGWSATTDALALALQSAALLAAFGSRRVLAPLLSGALLALAALTRYSAVALLPATLLGLALEPGAAGRARLRAIALQLAGFALVAAPVLAWFARSGHVPGELLFHNVAFDVIATADGRTLADYQNTVQPGLHSAGELFARELPRVLRREAANALTHVAGDARDLLGWALAALAFAGLLATALERRGRALLPLGLCALALYLALVPAPAAPRYSLALAPFYLALAGIATASPLLSRRLRVGPIALPAVAGAVALALSIAASARAQREALALLPLETVDAARALAADGGPGAIVLALKPHIAYLAHARFVPMPAAENLEDLASTARYGHASHLYYSWIEADNRPAFWYLLDPASRVAGLKPVFQSRAHAAALYRIESGFGVPPAWLGNDGARGAAEARFLGLVPASLQWRGRLTLALWARAHGSPAELRTHAQAVLLAQPLLPLAWRLLGDAQVQLGQRDAAIHSFERVLELEPENLDAHVALGWMWLGAGNAAAAERIWAPVAARTSDSTTLARMVALFHERGNAAAETAAKAAVARRQPSAP
jgi:tetratricopeptide (TPR) repeat protein